MRLADEAVAQLGGDAVGFGGCAPGQHLADERHIDTTGSVDQIGVGQSFLTEHDDPKPVAGIECVVGRRDDRRVSDWPRRHGHGTWWYWYRYWHCRSNAHRPCGRYRRGRNKCCLRRRSHRCRRRRRDGDRSRHRDRRSNTHRPRTRYRRRRGDHLWRSHRRRDRRSWLWRHRNRGGRRHRVGGAGGRRSRGRRSHIGRTWRQVWTRT